MLRRSKRRGIPQLNTSSTADISFMLLIFFLVTTSMDVDKGLPRQLPPLDPEQEETVADISRENALSIRLTDDNRIMVDDETTDVGHLRQRVTEFLLRCKDKRQHVISIDISRQANYETFFSMQNEIVAAYHQLRNQYAMKHYKQPFDACTEEQKEAVRQYLPQRMAETYPTASKESAKEGGES